MAGMVTPLCSGRGCSQEVVKIDTRVGGCDVDVGEERREKTGGEAVSGRPVQLAGRRVFRSGGKLLPQRRSKPRRTTRLRDLGVDPPTISIRRSSTDAVLDHRG